MLVVFGYAFAAGVIGLIPLSFPLLMLLEVAMVYHLSVTNRRPFHLGELAVIWAILLSISLFLYGIFGTILDALGPLGWMAKSFVAFTFVVCFGALVNWYYRMENRKQAQ